MLLINMTKLEEEHTTLVYMYWMKKCYWLKVIAEYVQDVRKGDIDVLVVEYYNKYEMILDGRYPEGFKQHIAVHECISANNTGGFLQWELMRQKQPFLRTVQLLVLSLVPQGLRQFW